MTDNLWILFAAAGVMAVVIGGLALLGDHYTLNNIKSRTVGDGQHGTARWATEQEIRSNYALVPFQVADWRVGKNLPEAQGLVLGSRDSRKGGITALVDSDDIHCLMIGASGVGKTAYFLYPNLEYACACGMSFFATDTKGDLARNYGAVAEKYYGYHVSVVDLRNPTRSDGYNLMTLINRYMDKALREHSIEAYGKAENLINILAHSIISPKDEESRGQNEYFYKAAEGVVASVLLLLAEFLPPDKEHPTERRHLVSVFILIQQLLAPSGMRGQSYFKQLMDMLPAHHRARNLASSALESSDQATASAMSTALAQMNTFMDIALEQVICFDNNIDAEKFAKEKTALFLILPEEDRTKNFMAGLMIQNLSKELFELAEKGSGRLPNRVVFYCDEFGTMPAFDVEALFSAGRSRGITLVPIIQSLAQLDKNYGDKGAESIVDNCQDTIFGGFAPNSQTAETLSKALGSRTVLTGSVSKGKDNTSQSLQMAERALLSPDELKNLPKGNFIVMKTGTHPMRTKLQLYFKWGISFEEPYQVPERAQREVYYAGKEELLMNIKKSLYSQPQPVTASKPDGYMSSYGDK